MKPVLFNTEMVRAILDGRKTETRRVVKPQPKGQLVPLPDESGWPGYFGEADTPRVMRPPYFGGDILYVRETWCLNSFGYHYRADDNDQWISCDDVWHPSIHMPKEAARMFLRVKDVRVERLQHLGIEDALKEGITPINRPGGCRCSFAPDDCMEEPCSNRMAYEIERHVVPFAQLWDSTIKPADRALYGWTENPWVWVIEFERVTKEVAEHG